LFSFWRAGSSSLFRAPGGLSSSGLAFPRPRAVWNTEHQPRPPPAPDHTPSLTHRGPSPGVGCQLSPALGRDSLPKPGEGGGGPPGGAGGRALSCAHLQSCSQGSFRAVVVRGPGRGAGHRCAQGTSTGLGISCRELPGGWTVHCRVGVPQLQSSKVACWGGKILETDRSEGQQWGWDEITL
jgi:hypothetical protein